MSRDEFQPKDVIRKSKLYENHEKKPRPIKQTGKKNQGQMLPDLHMHRVAANAIGIALLGRTRLVAERGAGTMIAYASLSSRSGARTETT